MCSDSISQVPCRFLIFWKQRPHKVHCQMQRRQGLSISIKSDISLLMFSILKLAPITAQNVLSFGWWLIDFSRRGNAAAVCHFSFSLFSFLPPVVSWRLCRDPVPRLSRQIKHLIGAKRLKCLKCRCK